jgi:hypothetical protein
LLNSYYEEFTLNHLVEFPTLSAFVEAMELKPEPEEVLNFTEGL